MAVQKLLEKLPGVASAETDKTTRSATVVYDKTVFDVSSIGDEGRYKFELREDSNADEAGEGESDEADSADASDDEDQEEESMIKIEDGPASEGSGEKSDSSASPSLHGPAS